MEGLLLTWPTQSSFKAFQICLETLHILETILKNKKKEKEKEKQYFSFYCFIKLLGSHAKFSCLRKLFRLPWQKCITSPRKKTHWESKNFVVSLG